MKQNNIALITALYNTHGCDLYKEIYFPIIKYCVSKMYIESPDANKYGDITALKDNILSEFGVNIPLIIIKQSIIALSNIRKDVIITFYEKRNYFKIEKAWDITITEDIDYNAEKVRKQFSQLTMVFNQYLISQNLTSEKSFVDLLADNTEETISIFENREDSKKVGEEYSNLALFVYWLKNNDLELYTLVEQIFWSSIIAGFLKRNNFDWNVKTASSVSYYLDSSIIFGILGLSSIESCNHAKDLLSIIKSAGSQVKIHPLTIREMKRILLSFERSGGTNHSFSIADAFYRQNMKMTDILQFRTHLEKILSEDYGIIQQPCISEPELDAIENGNRTNNKVIELFHLRDSHQEDNLREIHDVYLTNYVAKQNENYGLNEKYRTFFVTLNNQLIDFVHPSSYPPSTISPNQVIMNLWIHNATSDSLKISALTNALSHCIALNQASVKRKVMFFVKNFREAITDEDDVKAMYSELIYRSNKTTSSVDSIIKSYKNPESDNSEVLISAKAIVELANIAYKERKLAEQNESERNKQLNETIELLNQTIENMAQKQVANKTAVEDLTNKLKLSGEQIEDLKKEIERRNTISRLQKELDDVNTKIKDLDKQANKSVCYFKYYFWLILESVMSLFIIIVLVVGVYNIINGEYCLDKLELLLFGTGCGTLIIKWIFSGKNMYLFSPKVTRYKVKVEQLEYWYGQHPQYQELKTKKNEIENQINQIALI